MFVVLVYLGNKIPEYVFDNLNYLKLSFPSINLVFITDSEASVSRCTDIGVQSWLYKENYSENTRLKANSILPMSFRQGFWFSTTSRFFALEAFSRENKNTRILQIESDVWLAPNFPFSKFESMASKVDLAFPLETETTGAASVLYIRDFSAAEQFATEVREKMLSDKSATDMIILGQIFKESKLNYLILPTIPLSYIGINPNSDPSLMEIISSETKYFGGIFDSVTYGLYLAGEDPRNHRGKLYRYRRQENHLVHCDMQIFTNGPDGLYVDENPPIPIFCLHIHSKSRLLWKEKLADVELKSMVLNSSQGIQIKRDYFLTILLIWSSLKRRISRDKP